MLGVLGSLCVSRWMDKNKFMELIFMLLSCCVYFFAIISCRLTVVASGSFCWPLFSWTFVLRNNKSNSLLVRYVHNFVVLLSGASIALFPKYFECVNCVNLFGHQIESKQRWFHFIATKCNFRTTNNFVTTKTRIRWISIQLSEQFLSCNCIGNNLINRFEWKLRRKTNQQFHCHFEYNSMQFRL